jgi:glycosyltransferase involved in cell wall biosynthesis
MTSSPFFSIGVTTFNRREMLKECLCSIMAQTYPNFEVIVGNDWTEEKLSLEELEINDSRFTIVNHKKNLGESDNMNWLLRIANGAYFTWLADDDAILPTFLESVYRAIKVHGAKPCIFTSYLSGSEPGAINKSHIDAGSLFAGGELLRCYLDRTITTQACSGVFDRQYLAKMGGNIQLGQGFESGGCGPYWDNLLLIRASLLETVIFIPSPLMFFRTHGESISYMSPDVDAYSTAQKDLLNICTELFGASNLRDQSCQNLYMLLTWCLGDYLGVMTRSGCIQYRKLIRYLLFLSTYLDQLGRYRYRMGVKILFRVAQFLVRAPGTSRRRKRILKK